MTHLVPWEAARDRVIDGVNVSSPASKPVEESLGLALSGPVIARVSMPPFDNSAMDGFAVRSQDIAGAVSEHPVTLVVVGERPAGTVGTLRVEPGSAARIMTGGVIPDGADAVVPVEATNFWDPDAIRARPPGPGETEVHVLRPAEPGAHIRRSGESAEAGSEVLGAGQILRGPEIGFLISVGVTEVNVCLPPVVGVLSTGSELVPPGSKLKPGQIPDSNRPALLAMLRAHGFGVVDLGLAADDAATLETTMRNALGTVDFLLTSGGVSVGDYDLTRTILQKLGKVEAYRVAVKPGKPQLFGHIDTTPVFGLPGNPVSSLVVFDMFVLPALKKMAGHRVWFRPEFDASLSEPVRHRPGRVEFLRVRLFTQDGRWFAAPTGPQGSGILSSMTAANGYAILPVDVGDQPAGSTVRCQCMG